MRIAIVNDLTMAVEVLRRLILSVHGYEVAWTAADGVEAVEKCARDCPDLILMDLIMPVMDGAQATKIIMKQSPCAILVVTATVSGHAAKVFEALSWGALDAVATPVFGTSGGIEGGEELLRKIAVLGRLIVYAQHPGQRRNRTRGLRLTTPREWWRWELRREAPMRSPSSCAGCQRIWGLRWSWCSISTCSSHRDSSIGWTNRRDSPFRSPVKA